MSEIEIVIKAMESLGTDAKWALIVYFLAESLTKIGVMAIISFTILKVMKNAKG